MGWLQCLPIFVVVDVRRFDRCEKLKSLIRSSGFTLIELVMTMMIIAILAAVVLPRFSQNTVFEARAFNDEVLAGLQYAQKTAIASRRNVCVLFSSSTVTFRIANAPNSDQDCTQEALSVPLVAPARAAPFVIAAKAGTSFSTTPANFRFDALGRPNVATQTFQVVDVPTMITVERETGYVHP